MSPAVSLLTLLVHVGRTVRRLIPLTVLELRILIAESIRVVPLTVVPLHIVAPRSVSVHVDSRRLVLPIIIAVAEILVTPTFRSPIRVVRIRRGIIFVSVVPSASTVLGWTGVLRHFL